MCWWFEYLIVEAEKLVEFVQQDCSDPPVYPECSFTFVNEAARYREGLAQRHFVCLFGSFNDVHGDEDGRLLDRCYGAVVCKRYASTVNHLYFHRRVERANGDA